MYPTVVRGVSAACIFDPGLDGAVRRGASFSQPTSSSRSTDASQGYLNMTHSSSHRVSHVRKTRPQCLNAGLRGVGHFPSLENLMDEPDPVGRTDP